VQLHLGAAVVGGGFTARDDQQAKRVARVAAQLGRAGGEVFAVPEGVRIVGDFFVSNEVQRLDEDDDPGRQRHAQQEEGHRPGDKVALRPDA
jgi:hypothetical protein